MLFLKILACINKRTHQKQQKQQQGNHRCGSLAAVFDVEMKGRIELPPVGLEPQLRYSWMQQMIVSRDQFASRLYSRNYPMLPRCRCPSGPPTPSTTTCSRRFYAPIRIDSEIQYPISSEISCVIMSISQSISEIKLSIV